MRTALVVALLTIFTWGATAPQALAQSRFGTCKTWLTWEGTGITWQGDSLILYNGPMFPMYLLMSNCQLCDTTGKVLLSGNGGLLCTMEPMDTLNPDNFFYFGSWHETFEYPDHAKSGYKNSVLLPQPQVDSIIYYLNLTIDTIPYEYDIAAASDGLRYSTINMNGDSGRGTLQLPIDHWLMQGAYYDSRGINTVRHANGSDWWVVARGMDANYYDFYVLDALGLRHDHRQYVGDTIELYGPRDMVFSKDGSKFINSTHFIQEIYDFDRCEGYFYNGYSFIDSIGPNGISGVTAISPNNRFVYIGNAKDIYQYDLQDPDFIGSKVLVAHSFPDSTDFTYPSFGGIYLGPDNKLYVGGYHSEVYAHIFHNPNEKGTACNFEFKALKGDTLHLPWGDIWRYYNGFPNLPNMELGVLPGPCPTYTLSAIGEAPTSTPLAITLAPNPTADVLQVSYGDAEVHIEQILVFDMQGHLVLRHDVGLASTATLDVSKLSAGAYFVHCTLKRGATLQKASVQKFIKY
jgi:hypothetical protein